MSMHELSLLLAVIGFLGIHFYFIFKVLRHCWYIDDLLDCLVDELKKSIQDSGKED